MNRNEFLKTFSSLLLVTTLGKFKIAAETLKKSVQKMPVLFIGHGSPMNGIEMNNFNKTWQQLGKEIPLPEAVLCISAHWLTNGSFVTGMNQPQTIHDFGGFPPELFQVQYPAPGQPLLAAETQILIKSTQVGIDHDWGIDHGSWTILKHMYPGADIPVIQLSIDYRKPALYHYQLAQELQLLRNKGVLIIGSGNIIHNLGKVAWDKFNVPNFGYDWAIETNEIIKKHITQKNHKALINYQELGSGAQWSIPTPDHYYPLLYSLAMQQQNEPIQFFNDEYVAGSLSMTSVKIG